MTHSVFEPGDLQFLHYNRIIEYWWSLLSNALLVEKTVARISFNVVVNSYIN